MAYNEKLTNRVREALAGAPNLEEKKMFRGVTFMVNGKMCVSVGDDELMCRFDPSFQDTILEKAGCREMIHAGRTMKGFVFVSEEVLKTKKDLAFWLKLSLDFNTSAKASKSKKKSP
ncbi:MAG TPA: TfoX/Sxy family protein [Flavitalea sp.]|nr:TfoX/Sxy family protein [Flavitalea sp.]